MKRACAEIEGRTGDNGWPRCQGLLATKLPERASMNACRVISRLDPATGKEKSTQSSLPFS